MGSSKKLQDALFDTIFRNAPFGIAISQSSGPLGAASEQNVRINPMYERITGRTQQEYEALGWVAMTHPDDIEADLLLFRSLQAGTIDHYTMEKRYVRPDGSLTWVRMTIVALGSTPTFPYSHLCLIEDISEQKSIAHALEESERSKSVLLSHLPGLAYRCDYDRDWTMQFVSDGCFPLTGYPAEALLGNRDLTFNDLIAPEYRERLWEEWLRILPARLPFRQEYEIITADGERKWVLEMGEGVYAEDGTVEALEGIVVDITDQKRTEDALRFSSEHDRWTGLLNRAYLERLLENDAASRTGEKRALIGVNLAAIQSLSKVYGFHYTQDLLRQIADALRTLCDERLTACDDRLTLFNTYENRFVLYVKRYEDTAELLRLSEAVADALIPLLAAERIGGGIGVLEIDPNGGRNVDQMLKKLLIASERAMEIPDRYVGISFFDRAMEEDIVRDEELKRELAYIAAAGEGPCGLFLEYQPILDVAEDRICGFEALVRLQSKTYGRVSPLDFIPLAEKTKLIIPLGEHILRNACRFLRRLQEAGHRSVSVSVNISAIQLLSDGFAGRFFTILEEEGVPPASMGIELTESVFSMEYQVINRILETLRAAGVHTAIDDFGTGYSSLARERDLSIDCLKIDRSFIQRLSELAPEQAITGDIVSMAHKLGHCAVAEGVETEAQLAYLRGCGCDRVQGFLISPPLDEAAALGFLEG